MNAATRGGRRGWVRFAAVAVMALSSSIVPPAGGQEQEQAQEQKPPKKLSYAQRFGGVKRWRIIYNYSSDSPIVFTGIGEVDNRHTRSTRDAGNVVIPGNPRARGQVQISGEGKSSASWNFASNSKIGMFDETRFDRHRRDFEFRRLNEPIAVRASDLIEKDFRPVKGRQNFSCFDGAVDAQRHSDLAVAAFQNNDFAGGQCGSRGFFGRDVEQI